MIVIDSVGPFKVSDYTNVNDYNQRQTQCQDIMNRLNKIASYFQVAIIVTSKSADFVDQKEMNVVPLSLDVCQGIPVASVS